MLADLLAWWTRQMVSLLPFLAKPAPEQQDALVVDATRPGALIFLLRRRRRERVLGSVPLAAAEPPALAIRRPGRVVLRVPPALVLERSVLLPLEAERDIDRVLHWEMDRLTPFRADDVFWSGRPAARDRVAGRLEVALSLVPRAALAPVLAVLDRLGLAPAALETDSAAGPVHIRVHHDDAPARRGQVAVRALAGLCAALALTALATPLLRQSLALDATETELAALRPRVAEAEALRRRITEGAAGSDAVDAAAAQTGDALEALAALTAVLPDDTFLTELHLAQRRLTFTGRSAAAARLIGALAEDPALRDPAFAAPVMRSEPSHADLFSIRAELRP